MTYEDDTIKVQQDGDSVDVDFKTQPDGSVWIGIHGMDICISRTDPDPDDKESVPVLTVSAWRPGVVSDPVASFDVDIEGFVEVEL